MVDHDQRVTFCMLLARHSRIEVPLIQRDYAQGREAERDVRDEFLKALHDALSLPPGDPTLPLNLDFVYGSMEHGDFDSFLPLDGQQRLTTLFLLHWYLGWRDGQHSDFESMLWDGRHSRFTYGVRPSSAEFFDELVRYVPHDTPDKVSTVRSLIEDQSWFFLHWRLDPTIQSVLVMLESIHGLFQSSTGLFARLTDNDRPTITFELLPLKHFGLTDDLYIKMNARGKPLTPFETFKARFEELLGNLFPNETRELGGGNVSIAEFFERRIDTRWADFFWSKKDPEVHSFDDLVMNLILSLVRVSLDPASPRFSQDTTLLRERSLAGSFSLFHERGWLTSDFSRSLICLLEAWSRSTEQLIPVLPSALYFDEATFFQEAIREPAALNYSQLVQFAAFVSYLRHHEGNVQPAQLNEWMRVVRNLATNSEIERPEEYGRALAGIRKLLAHSANILEHLSITNVEQIGFSTPQVIEECLKARLILADSGWRDRIYEAEEHGYFSGQIEFLLDFCGALAQADEKPSKWTDAVHAQLQAVFDGYFTKAQLTFTGSGLAPTKPTAAPHLWKRALLSVGDYLFPFGSNYSFLTDPPSNGDSWKRFLRSGGRGTRQYLKTLWDRIDAIAEIEPQLDMIITTAGTLELWRDAMVKHPEVISYCGEQEIRRVEGAEELYLLKKRQMNGAHAELFSYVLYLELANLGADSLVPLELQPYQSVRMSEMEPHVLFTFERAGHLARFSVESAMSQFRVHTSFAELTDLPDVAAALSGGASFANMDGNFTRLVPREDIHGVLQQIAETLANLPG